MSEAEASDAFVCLACKDGRVDRDNSICDQCAERIVRPGPYEKGDRLDEVVETLRAVLIDERRARRRAEAKLASFMEVHKLIIAERDKAREERGTAFAKDVWHWMGNGEDHAKTLSCPVVMEASAMRKLLEEKEAALAVVEVAKVIHMPETEGDAAAAYMELPGLLRYFDAKSEWKPALASEQSVIISYWNWKNVHGYRKIRPIRLEFGTSDYHPGQWTVFAIDEKKGEARHFALSGIKGWSNA